MSENIYIEYNRANNDFAKENRKKSTLAESKIREELLRNKKTGYKFTRQKPLGPFIADFYCSKLRLVIELDGSSHDGRETEDAERTAIINNLGITVIRYTNNEVIEKLDYVKENLKNEIKKRTTYIQLPSPLLRGEVKRGLLQLPNKERFVHTQRESMDPKLLEYSSNPHTTISNLGQSQLALLDQNFDNKDLASRISKHNISGHRHANKDFHYKFKAIKPKIKLYYFQGNIKLLNQQILGIVGPRIISPYTKKVLENLFDQAKNYKLTTISGLAPGVDQYAHTLSLQHKIPTIAVLGGGIKRYREHKDRNLLQKIIDNDGLILSEYKLDFEPTKYSFPQRNRIIAGLCNTLFIPQAGKKSGSLITADFALDMKKLIYGAPNDIFAAQHQGLHEYMAQKKVTVSLDHNIFLQKHFGTSTQLPSPLSRGEVKRGLTHLPNEEGINYVNLTPDQQKLIKLFQKHTSLNHKQLMQHTKLPIHQLINILSILEIKGLIYQKAPGVFAHLR